MIQRIISRATSLFTRKRSVFSEVSLPYRVFVSEEARLVAIASTYDASSLVTTDTIASHALILYDLDSLALVNTFHNVKLPVLDVAFHPVERILAIGLGDYDGGSQNRGDLYIWNYGANVLTSVLHHVDTRRRVISCSFNSTGSILIFSLSGLEDLFHYDKYAREYCISFPLSSVHHIMLLVPDRVYSDVCEEDSRSSIMRLVASANSELQAIAASRGRLFTQRQSSVYVDTDSLTGPILL